MEEKYSKFNGADIRGKRKDSSDNEMTGDKALMSLLKNTSSDKIDQNLTKNQNSFEKNSDSRRLKGMGLGSEGKWEQAGKMLGEQLWKVKKEAKERAKESLLHHQKK